MMSPKRKSHMRSTIGFDMLVKDVMTTDVITVQKFESVLAVADILASRNISGIPVVDKQGKVTGIITQADILSVVGIRKDRTFKDLLKHMLGEPLLERKMGDIVGDVMTAPVHTTTPETNIAMVVLIMDEKKIRRLPVVDEKKRLVGIISRADILKAILRKLK
jgi:CBS domain-containing protein